MVKGRDIAIGIAFAVSLTFLTVAATDAISAMEHHDDVCQEAGGHPKYLWRTWICVSDDGRIIE